MITSACDGRFSVVGVRCVAVQRLCHVVVTRWLCAIVAVIGLTTLSGCIDEEEVADTPQGNANKSAAIVKVFRKLIFIIKSEILSLL